MTMSIEEFKEIYKTSTQQTDVSEEQAEETIQKEIDYPNSTYMVVSKIGYLIGVPKEIFDRRQLDGEHYAKMNQNKNARIIRNLCLIRNGIEQNYTKIRTASMPSWISGFPWACARSSIRIRSTPSFWLPPIPITGA